MGRPFSERVATDDWFRDATAWIGERLAHVGMTITGPVTQRRIRPWSTQLTVPTASGLVWFKANCSAMAFEPALQSTLARLVPDVVDQPIAADASRGWMLTADRGETLGDSHEPSLDEWQHVVAEAVHLQRELARHRDQLLAAGLPNCSPVTVVERYDRLIATFTALPAEHPTHVSPELESRLRAVRSRIVDAAHRLEESALPVSWQHGDLHPSNVFELHGGGLRLFDFGDSQWAHPLEILSVPHGWVSTYSSLDWDAVMGSYCDGWGTTTSDLADDWQAASLTQPVNRTLLWWGALEQATAADWATWGAGPLDHLTRVLDG